MSIKCSPEFVKNEVSVCIKVKEILIFHMNVVQMLVSLMTGKK